MTHPAAATRLLTAILMAGAALLPSGCTDPELSPSGSDGNMIAFSPSIKSGATSRAEKPYSANKFGDNMWLITSPEPEGSRATSITTENFADNYKQFGVYGYAFQGDWSTAKLQIYMNGDAAEQKGDAWTTEDPRFWPGSDYKMRFFAYAPYGLDYTLDDNVMPVIVYTVPSTAEEQKDLLGAWAYTGDKNFDIPGDYDAKVNLHFVHLLTQVTVKTDSITDLGAMKTVTISGVQHTGRFISTNMTWQKDYETTTDSFSSGTEGGFTFMMLPQLLTGNAKMTIEFEKGTLSGTIGGGDRQDWLPGSKLVYTISRTGNINVLEVDPTEVTVPDSGSSISYTIKSYQINGQTGEQTAVPWKIDYVDGNTSLFNTWEEWWNYTETWRSADQRAYGDGSITGEERGPFQATKMPDGYFTTLPDLDVPTNVNSLYWDLSLPAPTEVNQPTQDRDISKRNTANAYVFYGQNYFIFPAAYGNSIQNGEEKPDVYKGMHNDAGDEITAAYMTKDDIDGAELVWEDIPDLIEVLKLMTWGELKKVAPGASSSKDPDDRLFVVVRWRPSSGMRQGNAVVAVTKDNTIIWSWHIWICNYNGQHTLEHNGVQYLPYNLGIAGAMVSGRRVMMVHFIQPSTGQTATLTITQGKKEIIHLPGAVLQYQWGRKDPFLSSTRPLFWTATPGNMNAHVIDDYTYTTLDTDVFGIVNPMDFYTNWNPPHNTWAGGKKALYDPCPPGFRLPTQNELNALIDILPETGYRDPLMTDGVKEHQGGKYYYAGDWGEWYMDPTISNLTPAYGFGIRPVKE